MTTREILKAHPRPWPSPQRGLSLHGSRGVIITVLAILTLCLCGAWGLNRWYTATRKYLVQSRLSPVVDRFSEAFEARWTLPPAIPPFTKGDEPELQNALRAHPLLVALVARQEDRRVWIRQGARLVRAGESSESRFYLRLANKLECQGVPFDFPSKSEDPDFRRLLTGVCRNESFAFVRRVEPGSPALDSELALLLGPAPRILVNLRHTGVAAPSAWAATPYQIPFSQIGGHAFTTGYWTRTQTMGWHWTFAPGRGLESAMITALAGRVALVALPLMLLLALLLLRVWLKRRRQRQMEAANERLATLIQGIRRPLAVLEARCKAIRSKELPRNAADCELIHVGEEVEHLSLLIENGLKAALGRGASRSGDRVTRAWMASIAEDFEPSFELAGRSLRVSLQEEGAIAGLPALRQVIQAFLENALLHGAGTVHLKSSRAGARLRIEVSDEGPGLEAHELRDLGQPFLRFSSRDSGLGLGLNLALQIAEREGWGVAFATAPGRGFCASLELIVPRGPWKSSLVPEWRHPSRLVRERLS